MAGHPPCFVSGVIFTPSIVEIAAESQFDLRPNRQDGIGFATLSQWFILSRRYAASFSGWEGALVIDGEEMRGIVRTIEMASRQWCGLHCDIVLRASRSSLLPNSRKLGHFFCRHRRSLMWLTGVPRQPLPEDQPSRRCSRRFLERRSPRTNRLVPSTTPDHLRLVRSH